MTVHDAYEAQFHARYDGALDAAEEAALAAHLATCAACKAAWDAYQSAADALRGTGRRTAPVAHVAQVLARTTRAGAERAAQPPVNVAPRRVARSRRVASHLAALAAGVAGALLWPKPAREAVEAPSGAAPVAHVAPQGGSNRPSPADRERDAERASGASQVALAALAARAQGLAAQHLALATQTAEAARARAEAALAAERSAALTAELATARAQQLERERAADERARERDHELALARTSAAAVAMETTRAAERARAAEAAERAVLALGRGFTALADTWLALDTRASERRVLARADPPRPDGDAEGLSAFAESSSPLTVQRGPNGVRLSTSGTTEEVVTALLARLDDPDPDVRAALELRLGGLAQSLGVPRARRATEDAGRWWRSRGASALDPARGELEPWSAWWERARQTLPR